MGFSPEGPHFTYPELVNRFLHPLYRSRDGWRAALQTTPMDELIKQRNSLRWNVNAGHALDRYYGQPATIGVTLLVVAATVITREPVLLLSGVAFGTLEVALKMQNRSCRNDLQEVENAINRRFQSPLATNPKKMN